MLEIRLLFRDLQTSQANNSRILRTKNARFSGYCFYMNTNIYRDIRISISVPLSFKLKLIVFPSDKNSILKEWIQNTFIVHTLTLREKSWLYKHYSLSHCYHRQDTLSTAHFHRDYIFRSKRRSEHYLHRNFVPTKNQTFTIFITSCKMGRFILD